MGLMLRKDNKACECSVLYSSWVWGAESSGTGRLYLLQNIVPDIPKVASVVFQLGIVLSGHSGDRHHPRREVQAIVENSVADGPWRKKIHWLWQALPPTVPTVLSGPKSPLSHT